MFQIVLFNMISFHEQRHMNSLYGIGSPTMFEPISRNFGIDLRHLLNCPLSGCGEARPMRRAREQADSSSDEEQPPPQRHRAPALDPPANVPPWIQDLPDMTEFRLWLFLRLSSGTLSSKDVCTGAYAVRGHPDLGVTDLELSPDSPGNNFEKKVATVCYIW